MARILRPVLTIVIMMRTGAAVVMMMMMVLQLVHIDITIGRCVAQMM